MTVRAPIGWICKREWYLSFYDVESFFRGSGSAPWKFYWIKEIWSWPSTVPFEVIALDLSTTWICYVRKRKFIFGAKIHGFLEISRNYVFKTKFVKKKIHNFFNIFVTFYNNQIRYSKKESFPKKIRKTVLNIDTTFVELYLVGVECSIHSFRAQKYILPHCNIVLSCCSQQSHVLSESVLKSIYFYALERLHGRILF